MDYIAIDLKSFYASVECIALGLDPLTTNLVVADPSRTDKTICLAVSPSLTSFGIPGRARLFEVKQRVKEVNKERLYKAPSHRFFGVSVNAPELERDPSLELDFLTATPRMALYMDYSTRIYEIYLRYIAPEDIHIYSVDEVFIDATAYLKSYGMTAHELTRQMIRDILEETGITATAGIGTNLYLCKIAMDIVAKHVGADADGVRIARLDEMKYRQMLWTHRPLTDFWRVGKGYARKLESCGIFTMGDIARCSLQDEDLLYRLFGINAELLIDHAWGWEPCTMQAIKSYRPENNSFSSGQVLMEPYPFDRARVVAWEMAEASALSLLEKGLVTDQVVLTVNYDRESLSRPGIGYKGEIIRDYYGREVPKHAHGTENLTQHTSSSSLIIQAVLALFDRLVDPRLLIRRLTISVNHVVTESEAKQLKSDAGEYRQLDLFTDFALQENTREDARENRKTDPARLEKERRANQALLDIRNRYGKNAMIKGISLEDGATGRDRNRQIGGHKA